MRNSGISDTERAAMPNVDFNGVWRSEIASSINLRVEADGTVRGTYKRAIGTGSAQEEFPLTGFAAGALLCLSANLGKYGSVISWVGQVAEAYHRPVIKTMWMLERYVPDPEDPANLEGATVTGYNHFVR